METPGKDSVTYKRHLLSASFCVGGDCVFTVTDISFPSQGEWLTTITSVLYATFPPQQSLFYVKITTKKEKGKSQTRKWEHKSINK